MLQQKTAHPRADEGRVTHGTPPAWQVLEAMTGFLKQFTGHTEVALGGADIDVSKIRLQLGRKVWTFAPRDTGDDSMTAPA